MIQCFPAIKPTSIKRLPIFPIFILLGLLLLGACKNEDTDLGLNLLPVNGEIHGTVVDTFSVFSWTTVADSVKTDSLSTNVLGAVYDPQFGVVAASLFTQLLLPEINLNYGTSPKLDSCVLILRYGPYAAYGNPSSAQKINVYKVEEELKAENAYYQNTSIATGAKIGFYQGAFATTDSVLSVKNGDTVMLPPQLRIKLFNSFGNELLNAPSSVYGSNTEFLKYLKGIALVPASGSIASGDGAIVNINLTSAITSLVVYYNDSLTKEFSVTGESERIQNYTFTNRDPLVQEQISNPGTPRAISYVQSMSGAKTKVIVPHLTNLVKDGRKVLVQEASITFFPVAGSTSKYFPAPERFLMFETDSITDKNVPIIDLLDDIFPPSGWRGYTNYGGVYNNTDGSVTFRFNRHLQHILDTYLEKGIDINKGLALSVPSDFPITPSRFVIDNSKTKVRIVYNKL